MNSLRTIFRWMLLIWLILVLLLGVAVSRSTRTSCIGNTMAFLFSRGERAAELPPAPRPIPPVETPAPPTPPAPEWTELAKGSSPGSGTLGSPEIQTLDGGAVALVLPLDGKAGNVSFYNPTNVNGATVDLKGEWKNAPFMKKPMSGGCLSLIQTASHKGYLRVSGVAAKGVARLSAKAEYSESRGAVRVVFSPSETRGK